MDHDIASCTTTESIINIVSNSISDISKYFVSCFGDTEIEDLGNCLTSIAITCCFIRTVNVSAKLSTCGTNDSIIGESISGISCLYCCSDGLSACSVCCY
jgi:hypothetical protein